MAGYQINHQLAIMHDDLKTIIHDDEKENLVQQNLRHPFNRHRERNNLCVHVQL